MTDVENAIYAIERCTCHVPDACRDCPYDAGHPYNECIEMLLKDVLELLKEQEAIVPKLIKMYPYDIYECGNCKHRSVGSKDYKAKYCPECGRKVKWDDQ